MFSFKKKIGIKNHIVKKVNGLHIGSSAKETGSDISNSKMNKAISDNGSNVGDKKSNSSVINEKRSSDTIDGNARRTLAMSTLFRPASTTKNGNIAVDDTSEDRN